ncbi:predicted protein [Bacteroides intestinalis CAG:315]|uniref:DUF4469 domain-containing protein n=1 Tax=Bacteroides intestinalis TaxID=329854 RepID=A0A412XU90_9BACE|nr:DUF4469 domain-containing protein [Bacteroides intestinalis]RGV48813.1 DUF4469 domain-containing protein [Bacteroides intestinalis]RHA55103.1 DUF4469 domain-containing protein [Bacteroides intestinalis]CDD91572.1 predicted protein [Bacteroides intestinalis CAG:315]
MTILGAELSRLSDSVPVITEVYDLLSGKHDGTITPWAPIIVSGSRLDMYARDTVRLCLVSATDARRVIEVGHIYKYSCNKVILALPELEPGGYVPAFKILQEDGSTLLQVLSVLWNVPDIGIKY